MNDPQDQQQQLTPEQERKFQQQLQQLPQGKEFNNWLAQQLANRLDKSILWRYSDTNEQTQQRTNRIEILDGKTQDVMGVVEPSRREAARSFAAGINWIDTVAAMLDSGGEDNVSSMHDKLEDDLSSKYEDMMNKITGDNDE